jgi:hypothetical protein
MVAVHQSCPSSRSKRLHSFEFAFLCFLAYLFILSNREIHWTQTYLNLGGPGEEGLMWITKFGASGAKKYGIKSLKNGLQSAKFGTIESVHASISCFLAQMYHAKHQKLAVL